MLLHQMIRAKQLMEVVLRPAGEAGSREHPQPLWAAPEQLNPDMATEAGD